MRNLLITDEITQKVCHFIEQGASYKNAYLLAGMNHHTCAEWRKIALKEIAEGIEDTPHVHFAISIDRARAKYHQSLVDLISVAAKEPKHWQAAFTILERTDPEMYSKFNRLKEFGDIGLDPETQSPEKMVKTILHAMKNGKISGSEGEKMAQIIATLMKSEENGELKRTLDECKRIKEDLSK